MSSEKENQNLNSDSTETSDNESKGADKLRKLLFDKEEGNASADSDNTFSIQPEDMTVYEPVISEQENTPAPPPDLPPPPPEPDPVSEARLSGAAEEIPDITIMEPVAPDPEPAVDDMTILEPPIPADLPGDDIPDATILESPKFSPGIEETAQPVPPPPEAAAADEQVPDATIMDPVSEPLDEALDESPLESADLEDMEDLGYKIGLLAINQGMMTQDEYEECYYAHQAAYSDMPFEVYLIYKNHLTMKDVNTLKMVAPTVDFDELEKNPGKTGNEAIMADGLREATNAFFKDLDGDEFREDAPDQTIMDPAGAGYAPDDRTIMDEDFPGMAAATEMTIRQPAGDFLGDTLIDSSEEGGALVAATDDRTIVDSEANTVQPASGTSITVPGSVTGRSGGGDYQKEAIDRYEIMDEVARGGMGVIYKARQKDLNRIVALKVMLSGAMSSEKDQKRFLREAEALANLKHPNIIPVYEIGLFQGNYFFSMEFVEGVMLNHYLADKEDLPDRDKIDIFIKVLDAIHYGHEMGLIHRDLKPANIMINQHKEPVVMDFGLVKMVQSEDEDELSLLTATGTVMGTPHYMAPEQAAGRKEIDARTDVFALGIILYEILAGVKPFTGNNVNEIFDSIFNIDPVAPTKIKPSLDWEIEAIILKALEKEQALRYQSADEMKQDLIRYVNGETILAKKISQLYYLKKRIKRHKVVFALLALVFLLIVGGVTWGSLMYVNKRNQDIATRKQEEKFIENVNTANEQLTREIITLVDQGHYGDAREKKATIESNILKITDIVKRSEVGTKDKEKYKRLWENELGKISQKISDGESEAEHREKLKKCEASIAEGEEHLSNAKRVLIDDSDPENRNRGKELIQDAIIAFETALGEIPDSEEARKGKYSASVLMGVSALDDKDFTLASLNLRTAERIAKTDEEKKQIKDLFDRHFREKNRLDEYKVFLEAGRKLFATEEYSSALAQFESGQKVYDNPEIRLEIKKARYKIATADADGLRQKGDYFAAASAYRVALESALEDEEKAATEKWITAMIGKGTNRRLVDIRESLRENDLETAEKLVREILAVTPGNAEVERLNNLIVNMKSAPDQMTFVEAGEFEKGSPEKGIGNPEGKVSIPAFYILKYEVSNFQFKKFIDAGGYEKKEYWDQKGWVLKEEFVSVDGKPGPKYWIGGKYPQGDDDYPVAGISYYEAQAYAEWLSEDQKRTYELPDELQWEKAASWDKNNNRRLRYPWGNAWDSSKGNFTPSVRKIGATLDDLSPAGCFDMGGNLHEWVTNSYEPDKQFKGILKGGASMLPLPMAKTMATASYRQAPVDGFRGARIGFRIVTYPLKRKDSDT